MEIDSKSKIGHIKLLIRDSKIILVDKFSKIKMCVILNRFIRVLVMIDLYKRCRQKKCFRFYS